MNEISYGDFSSQLHKHAIRRRIPCNASIEVTYRCAMRCVHCFNNLPLNDQQAAATELTYAEYCRILDEIAKAGCLWVLFTGGEVFARNDFLDIYRHAKSKGLLITVFTNGTLLTPAIADVLAAYRPFQIEITLYGHTRETHERITGVAGSYDQCWEGVRRLLERRLPLALKTMVITPNAQEIAQMKQHVENELGLRFRFDASINCRLDCSQTPLHVRLTPEDIVAHDLSDPRRIAEWKKLHERARNAVHNDAECRKLFHCGAGMASFSINPYGMMNVCMMYPLDGYSLRAGSFREGWENHLHHTRMQNATRETKCTHCAIKGLCGMCPAYGQLENRDPEEPVDFLCRLAHLRARAFGFDVSPHGACPYCQ